MYSHNINYSDSIIVTNHADGLYNGFYSLAEKWGGQPHWTKENRTAHIYYYPNDDDSRRGWWLLDNRNQNPDNIQPYFNGGYTNSNDNTTNGLVRQTPEYQISFAYKPICGYSNVGDISSVKYEFASATVKDMTRK